jgi:uncharacterized protein (UPF0276 family)
MLTVAADQSISRSIGFEMREGLLPFLESAVDDGLVGHVQVTAPDGISLEGGLAISGRIPVILHSNFLNVFGDNNWEDLGQIASAIRRLRPKHVIEHFTALRAPGEEKCGVWFDDSLTSQSARETIRSRILKWQEMIGVPVLLENVPVTGFPREYLELLIDIRRSAKIEIATVG